MVASLSTCCCGCCWLPLVAVGDSIGGFGGFGGFGGCGVWWGGVGCGVVWIGLSVCLSVRCCFWRWIGVPDMCMTTTRTLTVV